MLSNFIYLIFLFTKGIKLLTMKNIFPFLVLTSLVFFVLPLKIAAQQKKTTFSNNPVYVISDDVSSRIMVDGITSTFKSKPAGVDKVIKYGPWRMQNKLRLMTDSLAGIL